MPNRSFHESVHFETCTVTVKELDPNIKTLPPGPPPDWHLSAYGPYGFSGYALAGDFNADPLPFQNGKVEHRGEFDSISVNGNNDRYYKSGSLILKGAITKTSIVGQTDESAGPLNEERHVFDLEELKKAKIPENRLDGYYFCIDARMPGGWWRISYPYIRTIRFYGWPISPADTYRQNEIKPVDYLDDMKSRLEYSHVYWQQKLKNPHPPNVQEARRSMGWHDVSGFAESGSGDPMVYNEALPGPKPGFPPGLIRYQSGTNYPDFEISQWKFFLIEGPFFVIELIDRTYESKMIVSGPCNAIRVWNRDHFKWFMSPVGPQ